MAAPPVHVAKLYEAYHQRLGLQWLAGRGGEERAVVPDGAEPGQLSLIGHLNFIHPHRIQVLGQAELDYLENMGKNSVHDALQALFGGASIAVVLAKDCPAPDELVQRAEQANVPLFRSHLGADKLIDHLNYYLMALLADKVILHGVFMDVMGIGVLLTGDSAIGKSELALELITRGHRLVADDAPEFVRTSPDTLYGRCPELLRDFLEVRGLGILNVRAMFGDSAIKQGKNLRLIVHLTPASGPHLQALDRLHGSRHTRQLLEVDVAEIQLPVAPGRNLGVLVEAAARHQILHYNGYNAAEEFIARQRRQLESDQ